MPGEFIINISGKQREAGGFDKLVDQLKPRIEIFAPGYETIIHHFARLNFRLEITGVPLRFDFLDNLMKSLKLYMEKLLIDWKYSIDVKFIIKG